MSSDGRQPSGGEAPHCILNNSTWLMIKNSLHVGIAYVCLALAEVSFKAPI